MHEYSLTSSAPVHYTKIYMKKGAKRMPEMDNWTHTPKKFVVVHIKIYYLKY
jgi:hypothetical protein